MIDISKYKKPKKKQIPARVSVEIISSAQYFAKTLGISLTDYITEAIILMNDRCLTDRNESSKKKEATKQKDES